MLSTAELIVCGFIALVLITIIFDLLRPDLIAILVLVLLPLTGIITFQEALSGFSRSVVITIIGLFVITQALEDTGVVQWVANWFSKLGRGSEVRLLLLFMAGGAGLSLIMNNIAAGAVLLPAAMQVGRESNVPPSKLLMPLAFGTLLGGMATYFTTANIILSSILRDQGQPALNMAQFIPTGGLIVLAGVGFMAAVGRFLLPRRTSVVEGSSPTLLSRTLYETYQLPEHLWEVHIPASSQLVNCELDKSQIGRELGLSVLAIWRGHEAILTPPPTLSILADDYLVVLGPERQVREMAKWGANIGRANQHTNGGQGYFVDLTEVVIPPRSEVIGRSLLELDFRNKYHLTGVALWREGHSYRLNVGKIPLEVGDALLMVGEPRNIKTLAKNPNFLMLKSSHVLQPPRPEKARWVLIITALVLLASIFNLIPSSEAMMIGVAALALSRSINLDEAYRRISWRVVFLIVGMLPLSIAMTNSGLAAHAGNLIVRLAAPWGALGLIGGLFLLTMLLTQVIGGQVAALIIGPIAVTAALQLGVNAQAVGVAVSIACSAAFLTPIAHPVNVLIMGPGGYMPRDFLKVGLGITIVTFMTLLIGMKLFWDV